MKRDVKMAESLERVTHTHTHTHKQFYQKEGNYLVDERKEREVGITLIALVITIIILLILAGISIASLSDNGLFGKAKEAKQKTEEATQNENSTLAEYQREMNDYLSDVSYKVGDEVTVGGENFYVIGDSGIGQNTVTLLAKYNLNSAGTAQAPNANYGDTGCVFASTNYWEDDFTSDPFDLNSYAMPNTETTSNNAIKKAQAYGTAKGGTGRLLTSNEANTLIVTNSDIIWGRANKQSDSDTVGYLLYWLGTANSKYDVKFVVGAGTNPSIIDGNGSSSNNGAFKAEYVWGVRPVIVVSKSLIS